MTIDFSSDRQNQQLERRAVDQGHQRQYGSVERPQRHGHVTIIKADSIANDYEAAATVAPKGGIEPQKGQTQKGVRPL